MNFYASSNWIKIALVAFLLLLGVGSVIYNQYLVEEVLKQERRSVELWAEGLQFTMDPVRQETARDMLKVIETLRQNETVADSVIRMLENVESARTTDNFVDNQIILEQRFNIPAIVLDENDNINFWNNLDPEKLSEKLVREFKSLNPPIEITFGDEERQVTQYVYYGESPTVQMLRYFPYIQIVLLGLLLAIGYTTYNSITRSEQSNLWVGMAKEAAHQLGTPISSLFGWIQLLKDEYRYDDNATNIAREIEKDIDRLKGVAERFGKIGSEPELHAQHIKPTLEHVLNYMERRIPRIGKKVEVRCDLKTNAMVNLNPELFQWAVENIVKNAMDAIKDTADQAYVSVTSFRQEDEVIIDIEDSGSGMPISHVKNIFKPGFSTKKRGWGLGLSLTKRIIEDYHGGSVFVLRSELEEGTTIRIILDALEEKSDSE